MRIEDIYFDESVMRKKRGKAAIQLRNKEIRVRSPKVISCMVKRMFSSLSFFRRE